MALEGCGKVMRLGSSRAVYPNVEGCVCLRGGGRGCLFSSRRGRLGTPNGASSIFLVSRWVAVSGCNRGKCEENLRHLFRVVVKMRHSFLGVGRRIYSVTR